MLFFERLWSAGAGRDEPSSIHSAQCATLVSHVVVLRAWVALAGQKVFEAAISLPTVDACRIPV